MSKQEEKSDQAPRMIRDLLTGRQQGVPVFWGEGAADMGRILSAMFPDEGSYREYHYAGRGDARNLFNVARGAVVVEFRDFNRWSSKKAIDLITRGEDYTVKRRWVPIVTTRSKPRIRKFPGIETRFVPVEIPNRARPGAADWMAEHRSQLWAEALHRVITH